MKPRGADRGLPDTRGCIGSVDSNGTGRGSRLTCGMRFRILQHERMIASDDGKLRLLRPSKRVWELTPAGRLLERYVDRLITLAADALVAMRDLQNVKTGQMAVAASQTTGVYLMPPLIGGESASHNLSITADWRRYKPYAALLCTWRRWMVADLPAMCPLLSSCRALQAEAPGGDGGAERGEHGEVLHCSVPRRGGRSRRWRPDPS